MHGNLSDIQTMQEEKIAKIISRNSFLYQKISDIAVFYFEKKKYEKTLEWIHSAAHFAWNNHSGIFTDGRMENLALEIGRNLDDFTANCNEAELPRISTTGNKKKVLHVATTVYGIGGHSRLIKNWVRYFDEFEHSLLLTNQRQYSIPDFLINEITESGGIVIDIPDYVSLLQKSRFVRETACLNFDYIFLHTHPDDTVVVVALATEKCPPVALVNHADHVFWLGLSVADLVIDFNRTGNILSRQRRGAVKTAVIPFLLDLSQSNISRAEARKELGISQDEIMLITIGSSYKYEPTEKHDFFRTTKKLLEQNNSAKLYLIGLDESHATVKNDQMVFLGILENSRFYQIAADIYLDGFPYGGGLASVESAILGAYPVFAYAQLLDSSPRKMLEFETVVEAANNEDEYIMQVNELIQNDDLRKQATEEIQVEIKSLHSRARLPEYYELTFGYLDTIKHHPREISDDSLKIENADRSLVVFQNPLQENFPGILRMIWNNSKISWSELFYLLRLSLRAGDTKITRKSLRAWLGIIWRKLKTL